MKYLHIPACYIGQHLARFERDLTVAHMYQTCIDATPDMVYQQVWNTLYVVWPPDQLQEREVYFKYL